VGLSAAAQKRPGEISGGMKQRVGIARALSMEPKVLLMDEPFGALDALTRAKLQDELLEIVARTHSTVVMVTHDVDEAVLLSDKIVMMTNGPAATIGEVLGHWPTLFGAFLYFDFCFAIWVLNGAMAPFISESFGSDAGTEGLHDLGAHPGRCADAFPAGCAGAVHRAQERRAGRDGR
jgi:energy-coupling factor transporter ATP-binding protein EcfA2